jgi:uncharacterized DUF497 family protein
MYNFEFDEYKSQFNKDKHGINFVEAQELWKDFYIELQTMSEPEKRFYHIGQIEGKHWTSIITYRKENIRIISVRRSRQKEVDAYEQAKENHIDEGI